MILLRYYTDILTRQTNERHTGPGWGETMGAAQGQPSD